ncbi:MAG: CHAT domain-containing protein [Cytophagaceae bacterium]
MNLFRFLFLSFLIFVLSSANAGNLVPEKKIDRINVLYLRGEYKDAYRITRSVIKSLEKNGYEEDKAMAARIFFLHAKLSAASNYFEDYRQYLLEGEKTLTELDWKQTPMPFSMALIEGIDACMEYGHYSKAQFLLESFPSLLEALEKEDRNQVYELKLRQAQLYYKMGFLNRSETLLYEIVDFKRSRVVKSEETLEDGKLVKNRISSKAYKERAREKANASNLLSEVMIANGKYKMADSLLLKNGKEIKKQLGGKDVSMADNLHLKAISLEENNKYDDSRKIYLKAFKTVKKSKGYKQKNISRRYLAIMEDAIFAYYNLGKYGKARTRQKNYEAHTKRYFGKKSHPHMYKKVLDAKWYLYKEDYKRAAENFSIYLEDSTIVPNDYYSRIEPNLLLFEAENGRKEYLAAQKSLETNIEISSRVFGGNSPKAHAAKLQKATFIVEYKNNILSQREVFENSLFTVLYKEVDFRNKDYIEYSYAATRFYQLTDDFSKASSVINPLVERLRGFYGENDLRFLYALEKKAAVDISLGNYKDAESILVKNLEIYRRKGKTENSLEYSQTLGTLSNLLIIQGRFSEAERNLRRAYRLSRKVQDKEQYRSSLAVEGLANLYLYTGKYKEAEKIYKESLSIKKKLWNENNRSLIEPHHNLSFLYYLTGDFAEAERHINKAILISENSFGKKSSVYALNLGQLAKIYVAIGDYDKAEETYEVVMKIQKDIFGSDHIIRAKTLNEYALVKFYKDPQNKESEPILNEALQIVGKNLSEETPQYAEILKNLALLNLEYGKLDEAEKMLDKANKVWINKFGSDNINSAEIFMVKGDISFRKKDYVSAKEKYNASKNAYSKIFDKSHPHYVRALSKYGQMSFILKDYTSAIKSLNESTENYLNYITKYFPTLSEREKTKFWNTIKSDFEFYNSMAVQLRSDNPGLIDNMYNHALHTKSVLLNSAIKVKKRILESGDSLLISKYESWVSNKELLSSLLSMTPDQIKDNGIDLKSLEKEIEVLEKELSEKSEIFASVYEKKLSYDWKKVRDGLKENEYAVEIIRYRKFKDKFTDEVAYAALIVSQESKNHPDLIIFENGNDLERRNIKYFKNSLRFNVDDELSYDAFWKPFANKIPKGATVYISSDGVFNQINFEVLAKGDGQYVLDHNKIVLVSSTRNLIVDGKNKKADKPIAPMTTGEVALFGNPKYYSNSSDIEQNRISQLPGAEREVRELNIILETGGLKTTTYLYETATEEQIKNLDNPRIFHIATHGFFLEDDDDMLTSGLNEVKLLQNPLLRSGLLLKDGGNLIYGNNIFEFNRGDGILTAYEAMNLNLDKTELVVLSACETGLGEVQAGEGVFGLQRAFLISGANSVIMTLFKVDDNVTTELMTFFYNQWIKTGDKKEAFLSAKKYIREKYDNPIYWGAFIMVTKN